MMKTVTRLAAASAVIGAVVAEVSIGMRGGIGRMLIQLAGQGSSDPAAPWGPTFGSIALGLVAAARAALLATGTRPLEHKVKVDSRTIPGIVMADIWTRIRKDMRG